MNNDKIARRATYFSILSNTGIAICKWLAGYFGNSYALIADAIESTVDIISSILVLLGLNYANKPADEDHPYGHGRIEPLITFFVVGFLIVSATIIGVQSIEHIHSGVHIMPRPFTLIFLAIFIVWKETSYRMVMRKAKKVNSTALKADAWHHRSDALTSCAAFIGITIALVMGKGYEVADDWAALLAAFVILYNSYRIFKPALGEIMDKRVYYDLEKQIVEISKTIDGVLGTEKCYIRKTGMTYYVDLHIIVNKDATVKYGHDVAHNLKDGLRSKIPQIANVLIHVEPSF